MFCADLLHFSPLDITRDKIKRSLRATFRFQLRKNEEIKIQIIFTKLMA